FFSSRRRHTRSTRDWSSDVCSSIWFVFQFFHLIPSLTALENVSVPMEIIGLRDARARAGRLLAEVGLTERAHHYPSQLSGGEQQIGRASCRESGKTQEGRTTCKTR